MGKNSQVRWRRKVLMKSPRHRRRFLRRKERFYDGDSSWLGLPPVIRTKEIFNTSWPAFQVINKFEQKGRTAGYGTQINAAKSLVKRLNRVNNNIATLGGNTNNVLCVRRAS